MIAQTKNLKNNNKRNIKEIAKIIYLLKLNGITQKAIAAELNIKPQVVNNAINGRIKSSRVDNWLKENLNIEIN